MAFFVPVHGTAAHVGCGPCINFFCEARSGMARDRAILSKALHALGCHVRCYQDGDKDVKPADINIFCESLYPEFFAKAPLNWLMPNPEWYRHELNLLKKIDLILCRTFEVQRIFTSLGKKTFYLGFTSPDHLDRRIKKDYGACLHLAGTSWQKGTFPLLEAWCKRADFPLLTIVKFPEETRQVPANVLWINEWLPEKTLRRLQNRCGFHFCLSETEGFGHYLMEAMAVGAVVVATDAPPMNEFITDARCLVPYSFWSCQKLATNFYVDGDEIAPFVERLLQLPESELRAIGKANRARYLRIDRTFKANIAWLIENYSSL
jgi:glycosyltransferase involved in cell wall biosynthesis